jgi:hypothetical protein
MIMFFFLVVAMFPLLAVFHIGDMFYQGSSYSTSKVDVFDIGMHFFAESLDGAQLLGEMILSNGTLEGLNLSLWQGFLCSRWRCAS